MVSFIFYISSCSTPDENVAALKFDPDRFLDDRVRTYLTPNPFIFLPFNAGPRICLGQQVLLLLKRPFQCIMLNFCRAVRIQ